MQVRFHRRVRLVPGLYINFGKTGFTSITIGGPWLSLNVGRTGVYLNSSLVGTGLRFRKRLDKATSTNKTDDK